MLVALLLAALPASPVGAAPGTSVKFATFNSFLNGFSAGDGLAKLSTPGDPETDRVAEIIQRVRPDVLLINEIDFEPDNAAVEAFQENYLSVPHNGAAAIEYPFVYAPPSNTGISSGFDLNNNGVTDTTPGDLAYGDDSFGFGEYPGRFALAVLSRYPIDYDAIRTFQLFLWKDMPGALLPNDPAIPGPADWYSPEELAVFRLSSKTHADVPIDISGRTVHFLVSHPTPPVFDGAEDRNGTRNFDEIRFWADYVVPGTRSKYIHDDEGSVGGLQPGASFVIAGDQNSDPLDGDSIEGSIQQLLDHPLVNSSVTPSSAGGTYWADVQDILNDDHESDPKFDTADFCDFAPCGPGNLRADYVLPRKNLRIQNAGIFWPTATDPLFYLTGNGFPVVSSDHRLVWVDVTVH
jgi:3-phytase